MRVIKLNSIDREMFITYTLSICYHFVLQKFDTDKIFLINMQVFPTSKKDDIIQRSRRRKTDNYKLFL